MRAFRHPLRRAWIIVVAAALATGGLTACEEEKGGGGPNIPDVLAPDVDGTPPGDVADEDVPPSEDTTEPPPCECVDDVLCTRDYCDADGKCLHENVDVFAGTAVGLQAPDFTLEDVNPESATFGETVTLSEVTASGRAVVLVFHDAECLSCREQSVYARAYFATVRGDDDVWFVSVNTAAAADSVSDYVNAAPEGVDGPAPPSEWPVLQDTEEQAVWERFCADTDWVIVLDQAGYVAYMRAVNFGDDAFVEEMDGFVDYAKTASGPTP